MHSSRLLAAILGGVMILLAAAAHADVPVAGPKLSLQTGDYPTAALTNLLTTRLGPLTEPGKRYVVQLAGPLTAERRALLERAGVELGDYLPDSAWLADLSRADLDALAGSAEVVWVGSWQRDWKVSPEIGQRPLFTPERQALAARGLVAVDITLFEGVAADEVLAAVRAAGGTVHRVEELAGNLTVTASLPLGAVRGLADLSAVQFVEEHFDWVLRNSSDRWIVQSNLPGVFPLYARGIHGEGQIVGHLDSALDRNHCSFFDTVPIGPDHRKIVAYNRAAGASSHGTHTAGTVAGEAGADDDTRGVAYMARIAHGAIPSLSETSMFSALTAHHTQGARLHTNSWGNDGTTSYDGLARAIDNFSYLNEDDLVLFAVTNMSTLRNPENAKNCLAVGASQDAPNQANHCSGGTGPTIDGRRKPEIYAPGCGTNSARSGTPCGITALTGTSMACPAVTGAGLLVRQYFTDGFYPTGTRVPGDGFIPSGALLKAVLLNSAVDMTGMVGYPGDREGWGRVLADLALYFAGDVRRLIIRDVRNASGLQTGQTATLQLRVTDSAERLKVTLVWTEPPASAGANPAFINDLNLEVVAPDSTLYLGNVFNTATGESLPGGLADFRNNVEQVHLAAPPVGNWTVRVRAQAVNQGGTQGYALVISGAVVGACPGDLNGDNRVDQQDLGILLSCYQSGPCGDLDGDGDTDQADLGILLSVYGQQCN